MSFFRFHNALIHKKSFINSLRFDIENETRLKDSTEFSYGRIYITRCWKKHVRKRSMTILKAHRATITSLEYSCGHSSFIIKSLGIVCENLTTLEIHSFEEDSRNPRDVVAIDLPNLTKMSTVTAPAIFKYIGKHKINDLDLNEYQTAQGINKFLETCVDLKNLSLETFVPTYDPARHTYHPESLSINLDDFENDQLVKEFLEHHTESLKKLKLLFANESAKFAVNKMKLEELTCGQVAFGSQRIKLKPNNSIKKLAIYAESEDNNDVVASYHSILTACKGVERLEIYDDGHVGGSAMTIISNSMRNLKYLAIPRYTSLQTINPMVCLETLKVKDVEGKEEHRAWIKLAMSCPNLNRIKIIQRPRIADRDFSIPPKSLKKLLKSCGKLREVCIGPHLELTDEFKDTILSYENADKLLLLIESLNYEEDVEKVKEFENSAVRCEVFQSNMDIYYEYSDDE